ncbi:MAG: hypothetical protein LCH54_15680 [Bacteroidetes bacterium]|nr:hypothetical protein [Bacteroidota bacterium]
MNDQMNPFETYKKYYLSTDGYYFVYRHDKYQITAYRVELFDKSEKVVDSIKLCVDEVNDKTHHQIIEKFEARILINDRNN